MIKTWARLGRAACASAWLGLMFGALAPGCGPSIPTRFVVEHDIDVWQYRRYQRVLDVEIAMENNPAVGHTATYVRRISRTEREVPFANVFVAVYENAQGLGAELRRQIRELASYETDVRAMGGGYVHYLDAGPGDRWAIWVGGNHIVKVGSSDNTDDVPEVLVATYMGIYGSDLDEHGRSRPGTPSAGEVPDPQPAGDAPAGDDPEVPHFLRNDAPR